jgi:hypothetical protein
MITNQNKYIISEFYNFSDDKNSIKKLIKEAEEMHKPIVLTGILQKANTLNRNGRVYPFEILKREAEKYMEAVNENRALGELDHPDSAVVSLANVSHKIIEMWWNGEELYGRVEITETPAGDILKGLLKSGVMLGISSRGVGSVKSQGNKDVVQSDFELIAFDFVSSPSTPGAYLFKEGREWGITQYCEDCEIPMKVEQFEEKVSDYKKLLDLSSNDFWKSL